MTTPDTTPSVKIVKVIDADLVGLPLDTVLKALDHESDDGRTYYTYMEKAIVTDGDGNDTVDNVVRTLSLDADQQAGVDVIERVVGS